MKIVVDRQIIDCDDIADAFCTNPREYHVNNPPSLTLILKDGETISTTNHVRIIKDESSYGAK